MHQQGLSQHLKFLLQEWFLYLLDKYVEKHYIAFDQKNAPYGLSQHLTFLIQEWSLYMLDKYTYFYDRPQAAG